VCAAAARGWRAQGIEPSKWAAARAVERGADVVVGELDDARALGTERDLVVLCDVLEHLAAPASALETIAALLRPGGVLYLTVPDAGSGLARVMRRRWWSVLPMHLQYFTRASMRRLLESHGFDVVSIRSHPKVFTAGYYADRLAGYSPGAARLVRRVLAIVGQEDRLVAPDFHDRMAVIATRQGA
jgi:SAM-dependent methyltransferase